MRITATLVRRDTTGLPHSVSAVVNAFVMTTKIYHIALRSPPATIPETATVTPGTTLRITCVAHVEITAKPANSANAYSANQARTDWENRVFVHKMRSLQDGMMKKPMEFSFTPRHRF